MTTQEIKDLAQEYINANWIRESEAYYEGKRQICKDDILPIFMWLSSRYCIVEKSKVKDVFAYNQEIFDHAVFIDPLLSCAVKGRMEMLKDLFGSELFYTP